MRFVPMLLLALSACTLANIGPAAAEHQTQRAIYRASYDAVYRAVLQQAGEMKWGVLFADKDAGAVRIATPLRLSVWADTIAVNITAADSTVAVLVRSTLGQGPNRRNVQRFLEGLSQRLSSETP